MSSEKVSESGEKQPFEALDARKLATVTTNGEDLVSLTDLSDTDEAFQWLSTHPRAAELAIEGQAILDDPVQLKRLVRKIDLTIAPLLACVYFLQFLDKTTLSYTAVMGIRTDTGLVGQDYSNLSMLFYIGEWNYRTTSNRRKTEPVQAFWPRSSPRNSLHNTSRDSASTSAPISYYGVLCSDATQHAPTTPDSPSAAPSSASSRAASHQS
jgi:hypothetical protein